MIRRKKVEVVINPSLLLPAKGILVQERGSRLPVSTNVYWSPSELKRAIFNKLRL